MDEKDTKPTVQLIFDERMLRAVTSAINYTLQKWTGEGDIDQEMLFASRPVFQAAILEFDFYRDDHDKM